MEMPNEFYASEILMITRDSSIMQRRNTLVCRRCKTSVLGQSVEIFFSAT